MTDVEELIRTRVDRLEETFGAGLLELPPKTRSRVRVRQIVTAVSTATAIALVAVLAVLTVDHLAMPRHVRPAGRTALSNRAGGSRLQHLRCPPRPPRNPAARR